MAEAPPRPPSPPINDARRQEEVYKKAVTVFVRNETEWLPLMDSTQSDESAIFQWVKLEQVM